MIILKKIYSLISLYVCMICISQKEMQIAVDHKMLGVPTGDTLLGKTVTLTLSFSLFSQPEKLQIHKFLE